MKKASVFTEADQRFMRQALLLAEKAAAQQEVPVGAVLVCNDEIIGEGCNQPISQNDPTAHAEIVALRAASARRGNYRLDDCTLYVTLEPCPMCAGALLQARIRRVVFAALDPKAGAGGSVLQVLRHPQLPHLCKLDSGLMAIEAGKLLSDFFAQRRKER